MKISADRASRIAQRIEAWFQPSARSFPWRTTNGLPRNPYVSLVSEIMLQQTQAARVAERMPLFIARFPDARSLASADEGEVLSAWQGLGYYRRARSLHAAARMIAEKHGGLVPDSIIELRALPGVGRYTAGAVASMAYGQREPCVDGNIQRVILRLEGADIGPDDPGREGAVWSAAERLVASCDDPARFNEGLMELGAIVCKPVSPACGVCPLSRLCRARRTSSQHLIPRPKRRPDPRVLQMQAVLIEIPRRGLRVQQRPAKGLWSRMWEPISLESEAAPTPAVIRRWAAVRSLERIGGFDHKTTHRIVRFTIWRGREPGPECPGRWASRRDLAGLAMSNAARRVLDESGLGA